MGKKKKKHKQKKIKKRKSGKQTLSYKEYTRGELSTLLKHGKDMAKIVLMKSDAQHKTTVREFPTIEITEKALIDISALVAVVDTEVGWYGKVEWTPEFNLRITEILVPTQQCHSATTEISGAALTDMCQEIIAEEAKAGVPLDKSAIYSIRYWGHSHVNMGVGASGRDDDQMKDFGEGNVEYMIRGIHNKKGETQFDIYYYKNGKIFMRFVDVAWEVVNETERFKEQVLKMEEIVKERVSRLGTTVVSGYSHRSTVYDSEYGYDGYGGYNSNPASRIPHGASHAGRPQEPEQQKAPFTYTRD